MIYKKEIQKLEDFIQNDYAKETLNPEESINNLEKSVVEIVNKKTGKHNGNGLLITSNGYILTADHCSDYHSRYIIRDGQGKVYPIKRVCQWNREKDIALLKINRKGFPKQVSYKMGNRSSLFEDYLLGNPVDHKARWDGKIINKTGKIKETRKDFYTRGEYGEFQGIVLDGIIVEMKDALIHGDSGGILVSHSGEMIGFACQKGKNYNEAVFTTIFSGLDLIQEEINSLKNKKRKFLGKLFK